MQGTLHLAATAAVLPAPEGSQPGSSECFDAHVKAREACNPCLRESLRLEANKLAAARMLQMFDNPVLALREYNRFVRDLNTSINVHNAVCKPFPVRPLSL